MSGLADFQGISGLVNSDPGVRKLRNLRKKALFSYLKKKFYQ
jgi:hypothetical protein